MTKNSGGLAEVDQRQLLTAQIINDLHAKSVPLPWQAKVLHDVFYQGVKDVFLFCGRKSGKSHILLYSAYRNALFNPGSSNYIIGPLKIQMKEIYWATRRAQTFLPEKYITSINNTEMRINLRNGSFILITGSDAVDALRGIEPHFIALDEIKDIDPNIFPSLEPNRVVYGAPQIIAGTPPSQNTWCMEMWRSYKERPNAKTYNIPTSSNPFISHEWLDTEYKKLMKAGDEYTWKREYLGEFVLGGPDAVYPMFSRKRHMVQSRAIQNEIRKDWHKMEFVVAADPGSTSIFAVLFIAINKYTKKVYVLDELYFDKQEDTRTVHVTNAINFKISEIAPQAKWAAVYDEAASWFYTEATALPSHLPWNRTNKSAMKKDAFTKEPAGISLIKDLLNRDKLVVSSSCEKFAWEMENYARSIGRDGMARLRKQWDHLLDCLRYGLDYVNFELPSVSEPPPPPRKEGNRWVSIWDDWRSSRGVGNLYNTKLDESDEE